MLYKPLLHKMKELQPNLLNDYEHRVLATIDRHEQEPGFPRLEDSRLTRKMLEDYLYDYQILLDSEGSQRSQLTVYGIIAIVPTIVLSAFPENMLPWGKWSLLAGVGLGVLLALGIKAVRATITRARVARLRASNADVSSYVDAVMRYASQHE